MNNWTKNIKNISFWILAIISCILNLNMFMQLAIDNVGKVFFILLSLSLEGSKIYFLIIANRYWGQSKIETYSSEQRKNFRKKARPKFALYFLLAGLAIIASFGYILVTLDYKDTVVEYTSNETNISDLEKDIDTINKQIGNYIKEKEEIPNNWITRRNRIDKEIKILEEKKENKRQEIVNLKNIEVDKDKTEITKDMFYLIGEVIHLEKKNIQFILMIILAILLEVCIFAMAKEEDINNKDDYNFIDITKKDIDTAKQSKNLSENKISIKENVLKYIYNRIYKYVQTEINKKDNVKYNQIVFSMGDINIDLEYSLLKKYFEYLSNKGFIVKVDRKSVYNDKNFYKLKLFKSYDELKKRKVR